MYSYCDAAVLKTVVDRKREGPDLEQSCNFARHKVTVVGGCGSSLHSTLHPATSPRPGSRHSVAEPAAHNASAERMPRSTGGRQHHVHTCWFPATVPCVGQLGTCRRPDGAAGGNEMIPKPCSSRSSSSSPLCRCALEARLGGLTCLSPQNESLIPRRTISPHRSGAADNPTTR